MVAGLAVLRRARPCRRLAGLDQVASRVADVGADFATVVLGLGQELGIWLTMIIARHDASCGQENIRRAYAVQCDAARSAAVYTIVHKLVTECWWRHRGQVRRSAWRPAAARHEPGGGAQIGQFCSAAEPVHVVKIAGLIPGVNSPVQCAVHVASRRPVTINQS